MVSAVTPPSMIRSIKKLVDLAVKTKEVLGELPKENQKPLAVKTFAVMIEGIDPEFSIYLTKILEGGLN